MQILTEKEPYKSLYHNYKNMDPLYTALQPDKMSYEEAISRIGLMNDPNLEESELKDMKRKFQEDVIEKKYARDGYYSDKISTPMAYQLAERYLSFKLPLVNWREEAIKRGDAYEIWGFRYSYPIDSYTWWFLHGPDQHQRICAFIEQRKNGDSDDNIYIRRYGERTGTPFSTFKNQSAEGQFKTFVLK